MGQSGGFAHDNVIDHQKVQLGESFFISRRIRIGAQRIAGADKNGTQALGVAAEDFFRHGSRWE